MNIKQEGKKSRWNRRFLDGWIIFHSFASSGSRWQRRAADHVNKPPYPCIMVECLHFRNDLFLKTQS